ncbi:MAG TPA: response regulator, partial [Nannocystaceae bacterium]|nr:response regulator [Nannocystaceae bacterium]
GAVVVVAFAIWCAAAAVRAGQLRSDLERRVVWLRSLEEAEATLVESRAPGPTLAASDELTSLAERLAAERRADDSLVLQLQYAAQGLHDVADARAASRTTDELERDVHARIGLAAPLVRSEWAGISLELGSHWRAMYVIAGGAIALAFGMLALLAYLRLVLMPRVDSDADRLHRLAHRLAQFDRAAHGVAHELNSPLTAIVTNLQLLAERLRTTTQATAATSNIHLIEDALQGLARVSGTVQDMRSPSEGASGELATTDVNAVVDAALATTRFRVGDSVRVALALSRVPAARAPDGLVQRLLEELLIGAFLVERGGEGPSDGITVRTAAARPDVVTIELDVPQRALTGVDRREFERRMRSLGGAFTIAVDGGQARVRFELPVDREDAKPDAADPPEPAVPARAGESGSFPKVRILLVDDDELVRASVTRVLAKHDVTTLSDGDAAIERILAEDYDLVLCDLMMPGKSGMEVYASVVAKRPELGERFVFISGGASTPEAERFLEEHATERLDKPFGMDSLRRLVADATKRRAD